MHPSFVLYPKECYIAFADKGKPVWNATNERALEWRDLEKTTD